MQETLQGVSPDQAPSHALWMVRSGPGMGWEPCPGGERGRVQWEDKEAATGHNHFPSPHRASDLIPSETPNLPGLSLLCCLLSVLGD